MTTTAGADTMTNTTIGPTNTFHVIPGGVVNAYLAQHVETILGVVEETYLAHAAGRTINPDSYFMRFPDKPTARIIALPSFLRTEADEATAGIKWISSWPENVQRGLPRASAVLVINDYQTGRPAGLLEAAGISAARTAAGAAIAARAATVNAAATGAFVGAGVIAQTTVDYLARAGRLPSEVVVCDPDEYSANRLVAYVESRGVKATTGDLGSAVAADLLVLATNASTPYIDADTPLHPGQLVLNISLRDLSPELLADADNYFDDVEHCMKAQTSPHLLEQLVGNRDFVSGTLAELLVGHKQINPNVPTVFSPFGLGVLDLAVGRAVLAQAIDEGTSVAVPDFIGDPRRWVG